MIVQEIGTAIELNNVTKLYNGKPAVKDISLAVRAGQIFGLIGPSGSGKTTLIQMMVGLQLPSSGEVNVLGTSPSDFGIAQRARIGYMPQGFFLYPTLTVWENMSYVAALHGIGWLKKRKLIRGLLEKLDLWEAKSKLTGDLSGGMMRRLQLASTLIHDPVLAFVDEPMEGLDPILRQQVWGILQEMRDQGKTVVMTTHNMNEAERCDDLSLISEGSLIASGTSQELRRRAFGGDIVRLLVDRVTSPAYSTLDGLPGVKQVNVSGGNDLRLITEDAGETLPRAVDALRRLGIAVPSAERYQPPFDEVFERLVRHD